MMLEHTCQLDLDYLAFNLFADFIKTFQLYLMKRILVIFLILINSSSNAQLNQIQKKADGEIIYSYTDNQNWDIFEVPATGSNSVSELKRNAQIKLLKQLITEGYNGLKDFKPLVSNPIRQQKLINESFSEIEAMIDDESLISAKYKTLIKPIIVLKKKVYNQVYIVKINYNSLRKKINEIK